MSKDKVVISLCDRSGNMVRPWAEAGYRCLAVDVQNDDTTESVGDGSIEYIQADVREYDVPDEEYRIGFAFPPCTNLAVSGARWMQEKGLEGLAVAIRLVGACHNRVSELNCPWMLENPVSTLSTYWRKPDYKFDPYQYDGYTDRDERYTKETWLWTGGGFRMPKTDATVSYDAADDRVHTMSPSEDRADKRAATPIGFARAVYLSHEQDGYTQAGSVSQQAVLTESGCRVTFD